MKDIVKAGVIGTIVADALGVPVEFKNREELKNNPVIDMREYGTHYQPKGTWSDDSSLLLASMDSIAKKQDVDFEDMMKRFVAWRVDYEYTPHGVVFDIGNACARSISSYRPGKDPLSCGVTGANENGNGSLMRIMAMSLLVGSRKEYWNDDTVQESFALIQDASKLTHAHSRSQIACVLYTSICHEMMYRDNRSLEEVLGDAISKTFAAYENPEYKRTHDKEFQYEIDSDKYARLRNIEAFKTFPEDEIQSTGYVVHTLEAAVWCLLNTSSYKECVLKAVNLGDDTDTVGAVAGGLAGIWYGYDSIPSEWVDVLAKKDWLIQMCDAFADTLLKW